MQCSKFCRPISCFLEGSRVNIRLKMSLSLIFEVFCSHSDQQINDTNVPKTATLCMVFGRLLCRGLKAILRIGLNSSSLRPADLTREEFHVASHNPWTFSDNYLPIRYVSSLTQSLLVFTLC